MKNFNFKLKTFFEISLQEYGAFVVVFELIEINPITSYPVTPLYRIRYSWETRKEGTKKIDL